MSSIQFLSREFFGNTLQNYLWFSLILILGLALKKWLSARIVRLLYQLFNKHCKSVGLQKFHQLLVPPVELFMTVLIIFLAFDRLTFPSEWNLTTKSEFGLRMVLSRIFEVALLISFFWIVLRLIDFTGLILNERAKKTATRADDQMIRFGKEAVKVIIAAIGFLIVIGIAFNLDVVSLIAGLGIGGLAIALAAKETLENLLGSFTIFMDKPFIAGDSVKVGNVEGIVETVGFRSTRIRSSDRSMITVPNKKMVEAELINETEREARKFAFSLVLDFQTTMEALNRILEESRALIAGHAMIEKGTEYVRFINFTTTGFEIRVNMIVLTPVKEDALVVLEEINFGLLTIVKRNNASFALPLGHKIVTED